MKLCTFTESHVTDRDANEHDRHMLNMTHIETRVSAAADRPARRSWSAHAKHFVSHHMAIKPFLLLGLAAEYRSRRWV